MIKDNYPFDDNSGKPLQLRRSSDSEARRSLIEKYETDLNKSEDMSYHISNKDALAESTMIRLEEDLQKNRNKKIKIGLVAGGIVLLITGIILAVVLSGGESDPTQPDNPDNPPTPDPQNHEFSTNPYMLGEKKSFYSYQTFSLSMNESLIKNMTADMARFAYETQDNKFIYNATLKTQVFGSFNTMRISVTSDKTPASDEFLRKEFLADDGKLRLQQMSERFIVSNNTESNRPFNRSAFLIAAMVDNEKFISTEDQEFILMTHYSQMSFIVKSNLLMGWGDRRSSSLFLQTGNYTIFPQRGDGLIEDYVSGNKQGPGAHPFLMMQVLGSRNFAGIFLMNTYPMSLEVILDPQGEKTKLIFRVAGGPLDFLVFYGPSFDQVLRQYHDAIGRPKMLPLQAHGFFSRSPAYKDPNLALDAIKGYKQNNFPLQGLVLPSNWKQDYLFGTNPLMNAIRNKYPSDELQLIKPFSFFVPNNSQLAWVQNFTAGEKFESGIRYFHVYNNIKDPLTINMEADEESGLPAHGWCMDVFNPFFQSNFLRPVMLSQLTDRYESSLWLQENTPHISGYDSMMLEPYNLPYRPGGALTRGAESSLPDVALHLISSSEADQQHYADHHGKHMLFGSQFARAVIRELPISRRVSLVISDSTGPGDGAKGIAHLLTRHNASYLDVQRSLISLFNYAMYGIANVGPQLCDFQPGIQFDQTLCGLYMKLAVISPLVLYSDRMKNLDNHLFNQSSGKANYTKQLMQRMEMMTYMRTQLRELEIHGGVLIKPAFTIFPSLDHDDISNVMFGHDILVHIFTGSEEAEVNFTLPTESSFLNLANQKLLSPGETITLRASDTLDLFQRVGTVIPLQKFEGSVNSILDMRNESITLSIVLQNNSAFGNIFLEDGLPGALTWEMHQVWAENGFISFRQLDFREQNPNADDTFIRKIILSNSVGPLSTACGITKDLRTVLPFLLTAVNGNPNQYEITAESLGRDIRINELAYIYYGNSATGQKCDASLFSYVLTETLVSNDTLFEAKLTSALKDIMGESITPPQYLKIELISDNSLSFVLSDRHFNNSMTDTLETPTQIYDRNFTKARSPLSLKISDVLQTSTADGRFCLNVTSPQNTSWVYLSTCPQSNGNNQPQLQHLLHSIFTFEQRFSNPKRFFGLGERKDSFFLQDSTVYALYNNDNNLEDSYETYGDRIVHGRNGFHPVIYSQLLSPNDDENATQPLTAIVFFTGHGMEIAFSEIENGGEFSVITSSRDLEFVFIFDLQPDATVEAVFRHVQLGSLLKPSEDNSVLPPPAWAFGHHVTIQPGKIDVQESLEYLNQQFGLPIEGILPQRRESENGMSFKMNNTNFNTRSLAWMAAQNFSIMPFSFSGYMKDGQTPSDPIARLIQQKNYEVRNLQGDPFQAFGDNGDLIFLDYSNSQISEVVQLMFNKFKDENGIKNRVGVQLADNEVSLRRCKVSSCYMRFGGDPGDYNYIHKPGNLPMTINTFSQVRRQLGLEEHLHNLNSLMEQIAYRNTFSKDSPLLISDSTALGSGKLGNVVRLLNDYKITERDLSLAVQQLQSLSAVGMPIVGVRFDQKLTKNKDLLLSVLFLNLYQPAMGVMNYEELIRDWGISQREQLQQILRQKYSLLAYTRTQVFRQTNLGTPFLRPLFFDFGHLEVAEAIGQQYMFGPSFISCPGMNYSQYIFPNRNNTWWCTLRGDAFATNMCFLDNASNASDGQVNMFLHEGTVTPVYSLARSPQRNLTRSDDLMKSDIYSLDLHIFNDFEARRSYGELLIDGPDSQGRYHEFCYLSFTMVDTVLTVDDITSAMGGTSSPNCGNFAGYHLKYIYLYDLRFANTTTAFKTGSINNQIQITYVPQDSQDPYVGVFRIEPYSEANLTSIHIFDIKNVTFQAQQ